MLVFYIIIMRIQNHAKCPNPNFKGYTKHTVNVSSHNKMDDCISESHLMRDFDSSYFAKDYALKTFPNGAQILVPGCSQMEAYTWATLFHEANQEKKYPITGFDLVSEVIQDAKLGVLNIYDRTGITNDNCERFLVSKLFITTPEQKEARNNFYSCFEILPKNWQTFNISDPRYKAKVKRVVRPEDDIETTTKRLEYIHLSKQRDIWGGTDFIPKVGVFENILDFKVGDVTNIDKDYKAGSIGIFSMKNTLYHLLGSRIINVSKYKDIDTTPAQNLFKKINKVLKDDGLFVFGTLGHDHFFNSSLVTKDHTETIKQNGENISVYQKSPIHDLLRKSGFEPAFYEKYMNTKIYLPSVWKKIKNITVR